MEIEEQLIGLCRRMIELRGDGSAEATKERGQVRELIRVTGRTAAFFGGSGCMTKLHDACEAMTGNRNEIGGVLNRGWDGIGGWWA